MALAGHGHQHHRVGQCHGHGHHRLIARLVDRSLGEQPGHQGLHLVRVQSGGLVHEPADHRLHLGGREPGSPVQDRCGYGRHLVGGETRCGRQALGQDGLHVRCRKARRSRKALGHDGLDIRCRNGLELGDDTLDERDDLGLREPFGAEHRLDGLPGGGIHARSVTCDHAPDHRRQRLG